MGSWPSAISERLRSAFFRKRPFRCCEEIPFGDPLWMIALSVIMGGIADAFALGAARKNKK